MIGLFNLFSSPDEEEEVDWSTDRPEPISKGLSSGSVQDQDDKELDQIWREIKAIDDPEDRVDALGTALAGRERGAKSEAMVSAVGTDLAKELDNRNS